MRSKPACNLKISKYLDETVLPKYIYQDNQYICNDSRFKSKLALDSDVLGVSYEPQGGNHSNWDSKSGKENNNKDFDQQSEKRSISSK